MLGSDRPADSGRWIFCQGHNRDPAAHRGPGGRAKVWQGRMGRVGLVRSHRKRQRPESDWLLQWEGASSAHITKVTLGLQRQAWLDPGGQLWWSEASPQLSPALHPAALGLESSSGRFSSNNGSFGPPWPQRPQGHRERLSPRCYGKTARV